MSVKAIDRQTVHQICSGQVVLGLATAVKELVENSLDAGATNIEVRLKEYGLELVEVADNGSGVEPENFEALTLKHHTSKLREFTDLPSVATFGFRGEALSSLCALSDLVVTTCHSSQGVGARIEYDANGCIKSNTMFARESGTTVSLHNLFHSLPVRYKEFQRNVKKEYAKMVQVLQAYCLISTGVRMSCYNQAGKGKKQLVLSTSGNSTIKENISNLFSPKQVQQLVEIPHCSVEDIPVEVENIHQEAFGLFRLSGYVSRCNHGYGRSAPDRQYYFFNNRPCDHQKLSKTVNEVYHMYNRHQYPFVVLNISTNREYVDVNLTPDKRQVMLHQEKALLILVRASLMKLYEPMQSQYDTHQVREGCGTPEMVSSTTTLSRIASLKRSSSHSGDMEGAKDAVPKPPKQPKLFDYGVTRTLVHSATLEVKPVQSSDIANMADSSPQGETEVETNCVKVETTPHSPAKHLNKRDQQQPAETEDSTKSHNSQTLGGKYVSSGGIGIDQKDKSTDRHKCRTHVIRSPDLSFTDSGSSLDELHKRGHQQGRTVSFDLEKTARRLEALQNGSLPVPEGVVQRGFTARITPDCNVSAEEELRREVSKEMFARMEIIGQFNLGFIIGKLDNDLFIIDQHATDEKYNFERLQRDTVLQHQKLLHPKALELTAVNETIVMDNLDVFRMNGFHFLVDPDAPPTERVKLTAQPVSKNWSLGPNDIHEMAFLLSSESSTACEVVRPSRVRQMFASRACRTSIMIGTPLTKSEMKKLIRHMGELNHPWNCPHGRPTMRHLIELRTEPGT